MIPETWNTQCAWCGSPMGVHKDCLDAALEAREGKSGPILICALCAEGNTIKSKKACGGTIAFVERTDAESMEKMRVGLNSSGAAPYIKRRLN